MKIPLAIIQILSAAFVVILFISFNACSEEQAMPVPGKPNKDSHITIRTEGSANGGSDNGGSDNGGSDNGGSDNGGPVNPQLVKVKVSQRDNIPLAEIETCSYFGQTLQGFWEYRLTTMYNGPKIYTVIEIIADDFEGL